MSKEFQKVLFSLCNDEKVYIINMDLEKEPPIKPIVLHSEPILKQQADGADVYKFNGKDGWFCSIKPGDISRMSNVLLFTDELTGKETIAVEVSPLRYYTSKDLAKAKPFLGAK